MNRPGKWSMAVLLTALLGACGCGAFFTAEQEEDGDGTGKGRYIAEEIQIRSDNQDLYTVRSLTVCNDGKLRAITENAVYASADDGENWEAEEWPAEIVGSDQIMAADMDRDGNMFLVCSYEDPGYYYISAAGEVRELEVKLPELDPSDGYDSEEDVFINDLSEVMLLSEEQVLGYNDKAELYLIDLHSGAITGAYGERHEVSTMEAYTVAGTTLIYKLQEEQIRYVDIDTGEELAVENVIQEYFSQTDIQTLSGNFPYQLAPVADGSGFYFCDASGLYRYIFGSSQIELIVNGATTYLSNPEYVFWSMAAVGDDEFYFRCADGEWQEVLLHYYYSEDVNTTPETELKVYSLYDSQMLRQAVADFQIEYSNYYVQLEIGIGYSDNKSTAEALWELDNQIANGDAPDVIIANGDFPVADYADQLTDLSGLLAELTAADTYFENIIYTYEADGTVPAVPTRFAVPMLAGDPDVLAEIDSFAAMADYIARTWEEDAAAAAAGFVPMLELEDYLLYGYQELYMNAEGEYTAKLETFLDALSALPLTVYEEDDIDTLYYWGGYTPVIEQSDVFMLLGQMPLNNGYVKGFDAYKTVLSINETLGWDCRVFYEDSYLPIDVVAIHQDSRRPEAGEAFIRYLLSEPFQQKSYYEQEGLPVLQEGLYAQYLESGAGGSGRVEIAVADEEGNEISAGYDEIEFTADHYEELLTLCEQLETPVIYEYELADTLRDYVREYLLGHQTKRETMEQLVTYTKRYYGGVLP